MRDYDEGNLEQCARLVSCPTYTFDQFSPRPMTIAIQQALTPLYNAGLVPMRGTHARFGIMSCRAGQGAQASCQSHSMTLYNEVFVTKLQREL